MTRRIVDPRSDVSDGVALFIDDRPCDVTGACHHNVDIISGETWPNKDWIGVDDTFPIRIPLAQEATLFPVPHPANAFAEEDLVCAGQQRPTAEEATFV